ncbi:hypothetical protein [Actinoplanes sp. NPDC051494]|uniref:hypothetical protein n=1 Tax=Actinoplanes sp. NPDC051494 TaxID=3363907 RepID=UPI0037993DFC
MRVSRLVVAGLCTAALSACGGTAPVAAPPAAVASAPLTASSTAPPAVEDTAPPAVERTDPTEPAEAEPTRAENTRGTTAAPATTRGSSGGSTSDLSQLKKLGIDIGAGVLIDVADDGVDRFMAVGKNGVVDFTGTSRTDSTMMSLQPAPVSAKNRVVIKPPFFNEDLGDGSCVADTAGVPLKLETCQSGKASQIWEVVPAGDSGQFELRGAFGIISVDNGKLVASGGYTGMQTLDFAS